jgi:DNA-binding CsgD family transcriptional regulator
VILRCAAYGLSIEETAARIGRVPATVRMHRTNLIRKLEARNITHAVAIGFSEGLLR